MITYGEEHGCGKSNLKVHSWLNVPNKPYCSCTTGLHSIEIKKVNVALGSVKTNRVEPYSIFLVVVK